MTSTLTAEVLVEGCASGEVLFLEEALSFWGGFDPQLGEIIDVHHPQAGKKVKGQILVIPASRGSAGTPACIAETLRNGTGPAAFILATADVNICVGVSVANRLYDLNIPVVKINKEDLLRYSNLKLIHIHDNGLIEMG